ncbi:MAG: hypothetical protein A3F73_00180 [Gallionellales bacterium RIFCSPLOWO2_12_FULL_59_22]|nr:MAG: hypothetical protein A2Z65_10185 [Gallionellales bacterium RIFCSPLOWO2_02_58_13]OGT13590.1 MAG: hypothetical protein A3F73_00180 [Gallionellales bacterium RIFCSPLOWO2_12_FULL_59_22]
MDNIDGMNDAGAGQSGHPEGGGDTGDKKIKPGRVDGKNVYWRNGKIRIPKRLRNEILTTIQVNRSKAAHKEKSVGYSTQAKREQVVLDFFMALIYLGYKIESVHSLKQKHLVAVFNFLEIAGEDKRGQAPSTIQNKISIMRTFCGWIGKAGMVGDSYKYVRDKTSVRRTNVVQDDLSWVGNRVDVQEIVAKIREMGDERVAVWVEQCWVFGIRIQESVLMRPGIGDKGEALYVREGTKGGRDRHVPIKTPEQRAVLEKAKALMDKKTGFLGKRGKTPEQNYQHFRDFMRKKMGITKADKGVTCHGLRHQYAQEQHKDLAGVDAPIKGGDISVVTPDEYNSVTRTLMEHLGHSRVSIGSAYYGSRRRKSRKATEHAPAEDSIEPQKEN